MEPSSAKAPNGVDASGTRAFNRSVVLSAVKGDGPLSRTDLARSTTLAKATVSVIVDELVADGLVVEIGMGQSPSQGGRPPIMLAYNDRAELVVGVHVGVQRTTVVAATGTGIELARQSADTPRSSAGEALDVTADLVRRVLADAAVPMSDVVSIGICLPGLTDPRRGVCVLAPNLGWRDVPVAAELAARLAPCPPVRLQNTAQAVALAENLEGAGVGFRDMLLIYVGTGVGAAIIYEREIVAGADGLAGEIGHFAVPANTRQCACGKVGCLETMASAPGIVETVRSQIAGGAASSVADVRPLTAEAVAAGALDGDAVCMRAVSASGRELGRVLSWAIMLLNPSVVVVAGGVSDMGDLLMRPLREAVREGTLAESLAAVEIRPASLGQEAKIRGAVLTALRVWENASAPMLGSTN